jgi:hypothetical protein
LRVVRRNLFLVIEILKMIRFGFYAN